MASGDADGVLAEEVPAVARGEGRIWRWSQSNSPTRWRGRSARRRIRSRRSWGAPPTATSSRRIRDMW